MRLTTTQLRARRKRVNNESGLQSLKVAELRAYAEEHGVDLTGLTKKDDILEAIREG